MGISVTSLKSMKSISQHVLVMASYDTEQLEGQDNIVTAQNMTESDRLYN